MERPPADLSKALPGALRSPALYAALTALLILVPAAPADGECLEIQVSAPGTGKAPTGQGGSPGKPGQSQEIPAFSAVGIEDLTVTVFLPPDLEGEHRLDLRFRLPSGHLYQTVTRPVVVEPSKRPGRPGHAGVRRLPDHPFPVQAAAARPARTQRGNRALAVEARLPVAGTAIVTSSLYGRWQVDAYLDGAEDPCAEPALFELEG